jgi:hypothetical protein
MMSTARQLSLFKSRRRRGSEPPAPSEYQLHVAVVDVVKRWRMPGWRYTHIASNREPEPNIKRPFAGRTVRCCRGSRSDGGRGGNRLR